MIAGFKINTQHFAVGKGNIVERSIGHFYHAQVAAFEFAFCKLYMRQVAVRKVAVYKSANFIMAFGEPLCGIIYSFVYLFFKIVIAHGML